MLSYWFWLELLNEVYRWKLHILFWNLSEQIMGSIRRHKNAMSALLAEFYDKPNNNLEFSDDFDDFSLSKKR